MKYIFPICCLLAVGCSNRSVLKKPPASEHAEPFVAAPLQLYTNVLEYTAPTVQLEPMPIKTELKVQEMEVEILNWPPDDPIGYSLIDRWE